MAPITRTWPPNWPEALHPSWILFTWSLPRLVGRKESKYIPRILAKLATPEQARVTIPRVKFLTVGKIIDPFQGCACQIADLARDFVQKLELGMKEILLIDMEAGVESFGRGMKRGVDTVLAVVEPSFDSLALAERILYMAEGLGIPAVQAVLNKVPTLEIEAKLREELESKRIKVAGAVYLDPQVSQAGFTGKRLPDDTETEAQVKKIAAALLPEQE